MSDRQLSEHPLFLPIFAVVVVIGMDCWMADNFMMLKNIDKYPSGLEERK